MKPAPTRTTMWQIKQDLIKTIEYRINELKNDLRLALLPSDKAAAASMLDFNETLLKALK